MKLIKPISDVRNSWNTGRWYQEHGQKIACQAWEAIESSGETLYGVLMLDISRYVFYFMPCEDEKDARYFSTRRDLVMHRTVVTATIASASTSWRASTTHSCLTWAGVCRMRRSAYEYEIPGMGRAERRARRA